MVIRIEPVRLALDDEARLVYADERLLAVITLQDASLVGGRVHVEALFGGDSPKMFDTLEDFINWVMIRS
jgi:hypothetical protein